MQIVPQIFPCMCVIRVMVKQIMYCWRGPHGRRLLQMLFARTLGIGVRADKSDDSMIYSLLLYSMINPERDISDIYSSEACILYFQTSCQDK